MVVIMGQFNSIHFTSIGFFLFVLQCPNVWVPCFCNQLFLPCIVPFHTSVHNLQRVMYHVMLHRVIHSCITVQQERAPSFAVLE